MNKRLSSWMTFHGFILWNDNKWYKVYSNEVYTMDEAIVKFNKMLLENGFNEMETVE